MTLVWIGGIIVGMALAVWSSRLALDAATELGAAVGLSPFIIGVTIVAVGTDLPEIANSLVASASGHGDLNVGDSIGSVVTQATLVLGILCLSGKMISTRNFVVTVGALTVLALLLGAAFVSDQQFSRTDGALLIALWLAGTFIIQRPEPILEREETTRTSRRLVWRTLIFLVLVGLGAAIAVESFTSATSELGLPEYLMSFFVLALGTSLPELVVDARALRRGQGELAMGDILGSSFVDATLSPGIGPLLFPTALSSGLARGSIVAAVVVAIVTVLLARDGRQRWPVGVALILLYLLLYPALIP